LINTAAEELSGEYRLVFIGTSGAGRSKRAEGVLRLWPRPTEFRPVLALDLTPMPDRSEPLYGATSADIAAVGAYTEGSLASEDPEAPGVALRVSTIGDRVEMTLRFGAEKNRRDRWILDGAMLESQVLEAGRNGFSGVWSASLGYTTYHSGGHFCAVRIQ
jgi:hypothetical protein